MKYSIIKIILSLMLLLTASIIGCKSYSLSRGERPDDIEIYTTNVTDITSNSATLHGSVPTEGDPCWTIENVYFTYGKVDDTIFHQTPLIIQTRYETFSRTIIDLEPDTEYFFYARYSAYCQSWGSSHSGDTLYFTTLPEEQDAEEGITQPEQDEGSGSKDTESSSLIAHWKFDEGNGNTAQDETGNNYGTLMGDPQWVTGRFGTALSFDGDDDYVEIANEYNFDFDKDDAFTIEAWVNTNSDEILNIVTKMQQTPPHIGFQLIKHSTQWVGGNYLTFYLIHEYNADMIVVCGSTNITDGLWHHIKVTYDGSSRADGVQIYVDDQTETMRIIETWDTLLGSILNALPLQISGREGSTCAFDGLIDEVKIWRGIP